VALGGGQPPQISGVVLAKARTHTAESIDADGGSTEPRVFAKPRPGVMGFGFRQDDDKEAPYFFTLLASILMAGSSILVVNAVVTSNGFSMPK
jgi:hypothetical protein